MSFKIKLFSLFILILVVFQFSSLSFGQINSSGVGFYPVEQKDFVRSVILAEDLVSSAGKTVNPIAKQEAISSALNNLKNVLSGFAKRIKEEGLKDWVGLCILEANSVSFVIDVNPNHKAWGKIRLICSFALQTEKEKLSLEVFQNLKKYTKQELVKFTIDPIDTDVFVSLQDQPNGLNKNYLNKYSGQIVISPEKLKSFEFLAFEKDKKLALEKANNAKQKAMPDIVLEEADRKEKLEAKGQAYYPLPRSTFEGQTADQWSQVVLERGVGSNQVNQPSVGIINRRPVVQSVDIPKEVQEAIVALVALEEEGTPFLLEALQKQTTTQGRAFYLQAIKGELVHPNDIPVIIGSLAANKNQIQTRMIALRTLAKNPGSKKHYDKIRSMVADLFPNNNVKVEVAELLKAIAK